MQTIIYTERDSKQFLKSMSNYLNNINKAHNNIKKKTIEFIK